MNGQPEPGGVLAWILGGISIAAALYAIGKRIFNTVTRSELTKIVEDQNRKFLDALELQRGAFEKAMDKDCAHREQQHTQNLESAANTFERLSELEKGVSRIEGQLSGRFSRPDHRRN